jgi:hypothetical protein
VLSEPPVITQEMHAPNIANELLSHSRSRMVFHYSERHLRRILRGMMHRIMRHYTLGPIIVLTVSSGFDRNVRSCCSTPQCEYDGRLGRSCLVVMGCQRRGG